jgi:hypothetical protein
MNIDIVIQIALGLVTVIYCVGYAKSTADSTAKVMTDWVENMRKWRDAHDLRDSDFKVDMVQKFGVINGSLKEKSAHEEDIIRRLARVEDLLQRLIEYRKHTREDLS